MVSKWPSAERLLRAFGRRMSRSALPLTPPPVESAGIGGAERDLNAIEPVFRRFVDDLLAHKSSDPSRFCRHIGPNDEMFWQAILPGYDGRMGVSYWKYIESCLRMFDVYRQIVDRALGGFAHLGPVLDFGSGYGRLTRSLVQHLPRDRIWVSDLYAHAIAWQAETLGVNALLSVRDPDQFAIAQRHSVVFAGSVFSHLPDGLFRRWLRRLYQLVAPRGVLVFSVHDERLLPTGEKPGRHGMTYLHTSESRTHGTDIYGGTYVTADYVAQAITECCGPGPARFRRYPMALYEKQDLYIVAGADTDIASLELQITPLGGFESLTMTPDDGLRAGGWGIDLTPECQLVRCDVFVDDELAQTTEPVADYAAPLAYFPGAPNTPVRWTFQLPASTCRRDGVVRVELRSSNGSVAYAYASADPQVLRQGGQIVAT